MKMKTQARVLAVAIVAMLGFGIMGGAAQATSPSLVYVVWGLPQGATFDDPFGPDDDLTQAYLGEASSLEGALSLVPCEVKVQIDAYVASLWLEHADAIKDNGGLSAGDGTPSGGYPYEDNAVLARGAQHGLGDNPWTFRTGTECLTEASPVFPEPTPPTCETPGALPGLPEDQEAFTFSWAENGLTMLAQTLAGYTNTGEASRTYEEPAGALGFQGTDPEAPCYVPPPDPWERTTETCDQTWKVTKTEGYWWWWDVDAEEWVKAEYSSSSKVANECLGESGPDAAMLAASPFFAAGLVFSGIALRRFGKNLG